MLNMFVAILPSLTLSVFCFPFFHLFKTSFFQMHCIESFNNVALLISTYTFLIIFFQ